jgi:uncharacterized membrane protein (DUF4010 family)
LVIVAVFNLALARRLALPLCGLSLAGMLISALQYWLSKPTLHEPQPSPPSSAGGNPLKLGAAVAFSVLFMTSLLSTWVKSEFGIAGIYSLAAIVGITDIDPFVLNLAQGGTSGVSDTALAAAILIAASSNNILKAAYAAGFAGGHATAGSAVALVLLAIAGVAIVIAMGGL